MRTTLIILICWLFCVPPGRGEAESYCGYATYYTITSCKREGTSGIITASGRRYDESAKSCALPMKPKKDASGRRNWCGKYLITNLSNGLSVVCKHTDYGPGRKARSRGVVVDLTPAAFRALGGKLKDGRIRVRVERL